MAVQVSIYNLLSKKKDIRYVYEEDRILKINEAQRTLEREIGQKAFEIVLTEIV